jgi:hypothetical protein
MAEREWAGRLTERIAHRRFADGRDGLGGRGGEELALGTFRAAVSALPPGPDSDAQSRQARPRWELATRAGPDIRPGDILLWQGQRLIVQQVQPLHRPHAMLIVRAETR